MTRTEGLTILPTGSPPTEPARLVDDFTPRLIDVGAHHLCPGCGEPIAMRSVLEAIEELDTVQRAIAVFGIGCYTAFSNNLDVEVLQALHGRAPSLATGVNRMLPDSVVFTIQGDGDLANEGLQEAIHAAARGESITVFMLNNGVFGETGGHMTTTTVLGQRTKSSVDGRDPERHGHPLRVAELLAGIEGSAYVARGAVNNAGSVARTKRMITRALESQINREGFSFVEILTMCPTGWFIETQDAPDYIDDQLSAVHGIGVLRDVRNPVAAPAT
jgi:2-oxoglutarate/2-oxoacid ferredoxin oxidoreductase subunit beta